jgi:hypothetical protein
MTFGMMIIRAKDSGTLSSKITYAEVLIETLKTGLLSDNRTGEYKRELEAAQIAYGEIIKAMAVPERRLWQESIITHYSQIIGGLLLPLCVVNKYILIESNMFTTINTNPEQKKE